MKKRKRTESQLFRELRINTFILAIAMIVIFIASFFLKDVGEYMYSFFFISSGFVVVNLLFSKISSGAS